MLQLHWLLLIVIGSYSKCITHTLGKGHGCPRFHIRTNCHRIKMDMCFYIQRMAIVSSIVIYVTGFIATETFFFSYWITLSYFLMEKFIRSSIKFENTCSWQIHVQLFPMPVCKRQKRKGIFERRLHFWFSKWKYTHVINH